MPLRPCLTCNRLTSNGSHCRTCQAQRTSIRDRQRGSATARGYDSKYQRRAAQLKADSQATNRPCWLCGEPINWRARVPAPQAFSAHHTTRDKTGPLVCTHHRCNLQAGQPPE